MTVINFEISKTEMHQVLTKREYINNFINSVKTKFFLFNLDGINIDFESSNIDVSDRGNVINTFMQELTDSVHSMSEDYEVTYASPAVNWGNRWDLVELAQSCDYLFIMGYPYYGNWSKVTGPTAPLIGGSINLTKTINTEYERINPDKLILGLPYYGSHWKIFGDSLDFVRSERYRNIADKALTSGWNWSSKFKNSWFKYNEVFVNHEIWIDNDSSLGLKYDFAIAKDLKGVGMWALGYDGARNEYWNMLDKKFGSGAVAVETEKDIENIFYLSQNYPNPFNPTTTISYSIPNAVGANFASTTNIKLSVYDILGNEVSTLVDDFQKAGSYSVRFNASDLSSGIYIYKLQTGAKILTRKMIVLK